MTRRIWRTAAIFGGCLALLLGAVGWITLVAVRADRAEAEVRREAAFEENVRLALWRMDSLFAPVIARESARPPSAYQQPSRDLSLGVASPLLYERPEHVRLHFQIEPSGRFSSPQVVDPELRGYVAPPPGGYQRAEQGLAALAAAVTREQVGAALAEAPTVAPGAAVSATGDLEAPGAAEGESIDGATNALANLPVGKALQQQRSTVEWNYRAQSVDNAAKNNPWYLGASPVNSAMLPLWVGDRLLLVRKVGTETEPVFQGVLLEEDAIRAELVHAVGDLLPHAALEPVAPGGPRNQARSLASLPFRLQPGPLPALPASAKSPIGIALTTAWIAVLLAVLASAVLIVGTLQLAERRATFVSAVTHELRTPLTTLQTYTEMLVERMVRDESKRERYLQTMSREAKRLSHLVENVLSFSRIERGHKGVRRERLAVSELSERTESRLSERAAEAGLRLQRSGPDDGDLHCVGDENAIGQILFNLVDNAAKYATGSDPPVVELRVVADPREVRFVVRDWGPGVAPDAVARLFAPFSKSAERAAGNVPGVGLGLALCRRLAREMGGDLRCISGHREQSEPGAAFELRLPRG